MKLLAVGVDYRSAPTSVREALAFEGEKLPQALLALREAFEGNEFVVLSTCNRVEVYSAGETETVPAVGAVAEFLSNFHKTPTATIAPHLVDYHDEGAVEHLFRVASSLESLVLGEGQIQGQVRDAFKAAREQGTVGPLLNPLFEHAFRVGKKVRERTGMDQGRLSIASVAVEVARDVFDSFRDKTVLVIGAGKMGELTLRHLQGLKPGRILVTNRSQDRAEAAAAKCGGKAVPFEALDWALIEADLVVSTTAAEQPIVDRARYERIHKLRRRRLSLILDIAVPRDFEATIGELDQVWLYNVDDLRAQATRNLEGRRSRVESAGEIIRTEVAACVAELRHRRRAGALLRQIGDYSDAARDRELERLFAKCPDLNESQRAEVLHMMHRFQNQLLHHPRSALRSAPVEAPLEQTHSLLAAFRHLFGLADG
jgi:glutamyl-tRNA reductase